MFAKYLVVLASCHFIVDGYGVILPILLPNLIDKFGLSFFKAGLAVFLFVAVSAIFQSVFGYLADLNRKRKNAIVLSLSVMGIGNSLLILAPNYSLMLLTCIFIGLGASLYHPQSTSLLALYYPKTKGKAQGIHGIGGSLGILAAPAVVGMLIQRVDWKVTALILLIPSMMMAFGSQKILKEPDSYGERGFWGGITGQQLLLSFVYGLNVFVMMGFISFLPTYFVQSGKSISRAGLLTSLILMTGMLAQPIGGHASDRWGGKRIMLISMVLLTFSLLFFHFSHGLWRMFALVNISFWAFAVWPIGLSLATELAIGERVGLSVGLVFGFAMIISSLAPLFMGFLADHWGFEVAFFSLSLFAALGFILSTALPKKGSYVLRSLRIPPDKRIG